MNKPTYVQERSGEFRANLIPRGHCGFSEEQRTCSYTAKVTVDQLDQEGFVIDNMLLDELFNYWDSKDGPYEASCEDLAGGALCRIMAVLGDRAISIEVTVKPNDFAALTCKWCRGCEKPKWLPRRAPAPQWAEPRELVAVK